MHSFFVKLNAVNNNGWLWRIDEGNRELISKLENPVEYNRQNWGAAGYKDFGYIGDIKDMSPSMIWIGDSHAGHYSFGLDSIMVKKNRKPIFMSYGVNTIHLPEIIHKRTDSAVIKKHMKKLLSIIERYPGTPVVISHFWNGELSVTRGKDPRTNTYIDFTQNAKGYELLCKKILKFRDLIGDREIIVIGENPFKSKNDLSYVEELMKPKYFSSNSVSSHFSPSKLEFAINTYFESFFKRENKIHFINPSEIFCEAGSCIENESGQIYFSDKDHLSKEGSLKAIAWMEDELLKFAKSSIGQNLTPKPALDEILTTLELNETISHNSSKVGFSRWYNPEPEHIWSSGESSRITFNVKDKNVYKGEIKLNVGILYEQNIKVFVNNSLIGDQTASGWKTELFFTFNPRILKNSSNTIEFQYSNPRLPPNENDRRVLAMALRTININ